VRRTEGWGGGGGGWGVVPPPGGWGGGGVGGWWVPVPLFMFCRASSSVAQRRRTVGRYAAAVLMRMQQHRALRTPLTYRGPLPPAFELALRLPAALRSGLITRPPLRKALVATPDAPPAR